MFDKSESGSKENRVIIICTLKKWRKTNRLLFSISQGRTHTYRLFALCFVYVHVGKVNTATCDGILTFSRGDEYAHRSLWGTLCWFLQQLHQCPLGLWTMSLGNCHWSMFSQIGVRFAICSDCPFAWLGTFPAFVATMQINDEIREQSRSRSGERANERVHGQRTLTICCILLANKGLADTLWNDGAAFGPWNAWKAGGWFVGYTWYGEPCS